ncbi:MAG: hypothetical protein J3Q66DRAFT_336881 [Benniella sp.]|nr:MAG: hypothetical protein J3Q66DRAFT_336881 [Benniella sp.]
MVKLSLSLVTMAASLVSLVVAAPYCREEMVFFRSNNIDHCIDGVPGINEPLRLIDFDIEKPLTYNNEDMLVRGGSKSAQFPKLQFCVVSDSKQTCLGPKVGCTEGGVDYRIRVHQPIQGYLRVNPDKTIEIIRWDDYAHATVFQMHQIDQGSVYIESGPDRSVITTNGPGQPVFLGPRPTPKTLKDNQQYHVVIPKTIVKYYYEEDMY